jgi:succinate dehydrogenase / fumarate reductase cytochrome b subunit
MPLGVFLFLHLSTNATILGGSEAFQRSVDRIDSLGPLLPPVEIFVIILPLLLHALLGLQIALSGRTNVHAYPYGPNVRYYLQRLTAYVAFVFIFYHIYQMHWTGKLFGGGAFEAYRSDGMPAAAITTAQAIQGSWWVAPFYAIGILCTVYHLANGIWTALITWGITIRPRTQRVSAHLCGVLGVALALIGLSALAGFNQFSTDEPSAYDQRSRPAGVSDPGQTITNAEQEDFSVGASVSDSSSQGAR